MINDILVFVLFLSVCVCVYTLVCVLLCFVFVFFFRMWFFRVCVCLFICACARQRICTRDCARVTGHRAARVNNPIIPRCPSRQSYEGSHDGGGVSQSLDGGVRALLEVVVVAGHVEGGEGGPAALHGAGQGRGCEGHPQATVGGQGALDGVGQGAGQRGRAGADG